MQKTTWIICSLLFLSGLTACRRTSSVIPNPGTIGNYQPTTSGSEWNYRVTGTSNYNYKLTVSTRDSVINGKTFRVFENDKDENEYHYKTGGDYYRFSAPPEFNNQPVEMIFLRDYLGVGAEWLEVKTIKVKIAGIDVGVTGFLTIRVAEKGIDYTVNGTTFKNVIHLVLTPEFKALLTTIGSTSDIHYYYAENVGLIYSKTFLKIPTANVETNKETFLLSYTIK